MERLLDQQRTSVMRSDNEASAFGKTIADRRDSFEETHSRKGEFFSSRRIPFVTYLVSGCPGSNRTRDYGVRNV